MSKILIICTGNSCRSQMAEGYLKKIAPNHQIFSAGTNPAPKVSSRAIQVMSEIGIDISNQNPKLVDKFINEDFDFIITVCDSAKEKCPYISGKKAIRLNIGFEDPYEAVGNDLEILKFYRKVRNEIIREFDVFKKNYLSN